MSGVDSLSVLAYDLRKDAVDLIMAGGSGHIGGDMSVMEILVCLYMRHMNVSPDNWGDEGRDRFILSKGHAMEAYYAILAAKGFLRFTTVLEQYNRFGSPYIGHPNNSLPGIEMNTGSLGHGLPVSVGLALAGKMDAKSYRVYTVMGDGELAEGSVWEGIMAAGHHGLDNLCAVVDRNGLQISGATEEVMRQNPLRQRFSAFGWHVLEVEDGNDIRQLDIAFEQAKAHKEKPTAILAHTVKGKGSRVMEGKAAWHHRVPSAEEYGQITLDFERQKEALRHE